MLGQVIQLCFLFLDFSLIGMTVLSISSGQSSPLCVFIFSAEHSRVLISCKALCCPRTWIAEACAGRILLLKTACLLSPFKPKSAAVELEAGAAAFVKQLPDVQDSAFRVSLHCLQSGMANSRCQATLQLLNKFLLRSHGVNPRPRREGNLDG